jgi:hypothetical protein
MEAAHSAAALFGHSDNASLVAAIQASMLRHAHAHCEATGGPIVPF